MLPPLRFTRCPQLALTALFAVVGVDEVNHPWLFVIGVGILGWFLPEIGAAWKLRIPTMMNVMSAVACALIAASFVL